ncbi:MAG TPA: TonB-dependent receptor [Chitinophagaceae bacterium]|jgi:iron complex outermembrane receptor protein/outer membrane receptor for ferrienterochelin and colicins|nr:TonB-dependent receptor [Chitinophagaceae bacterium]
MKPLIILILLFGPVFCQAQQSVTIKVTGGENKIPVIASVLIKETNKGFSTDTSGIGVHRFLANGNYTLIVSAIGYEEKHIQISIPYSTDTLQIHLETTENELEEIIVQSTRTSRTIQNVPTRVETIELEEIDEKNNMRPSNVAMLLYESTGIQVQQTSATSANASIRIQGLDGRYTQLLKDGFANFGNFSSGLSVLEIPPLDLKRVEIIKGPASPLFGGGAIAGVVNFISKTPKAKPEYNIIINQSNIGQTNIGGYASQRGNKAGYSLLALYNKQKPYDVDKDDFTEVPKSYEFTIHPKLFLYLTERTTIQIGNSFTKGNRTGGDLQVIKGDTNALHQYFEENGTTRNITTFELDKRVSHKKRLIAKQSFSVFERSIEIPSYKFAGANYNAFTDISYLANAGSRSLVLGGNFVYDNFNEKNNSSGNRDSHSITGGIYGQHTWDASKKIKLESGLRLDAVNYSNSIYSNTEFFVLPRVSLLVKYNNELSSRIGAGIGYKIPTIFTEETETIQYRNVKQISNVKSEKSYGGTADINYKTKWGQDFSFSLNHMFFYTMINKPLILQNDVFGNFSFINAAKPVHSFGFETNARLIFKDNLKLFLGYTFTETKAKYLPGKQFLPLVPKGKLNSALIYEKEGVIKLGLEGYFTGRQYLSDGTQTPSFKELGFMAEKIFKKFSLFINFENFTDTKQSNYKNVVNGSHLDPSFDEIWTHTEGFVVNGGIKIKL